MLGTLKRHAIHGQIQWVETNNHSRNLRGHPILSFNKSSLSAKSFPSLVQRRSFSLHKMVRKRVRSKRGPKTSLWPSVYVISWFHSSRRFKHDSSSDFELFSSKLLFDKLFLFRGEFVENAGMETQLQVLFDVVVVVGRWDLWDYHVCDKLDSWAGDDQFDFGYL